MARVLAVFFLFGLLSVQAVSQRERRAYVPEVSLYYEALCPSSIDFLVNQFFPVWKALGSKGFVKMNVVPYGKAKQQFDGTKWTFECQHGPAECVANSASACAIDTFSFGPGLSYINCVSSSQSPVKSLRSCANQLGLDVDALASCVHQRGAQLMHEMGVLTEAQTSLKTVPFVLVDGVPSTEARQSLLKVVCSLIQGSLPAACVAN
eukprot:TRINITY_DN3067_c0_g1_i1.p1 TRINITY_DN3067_c0_g1~~TRINITY_DN3067_c0_g1_i1.p1  ORF type:complete len:224 (-),score=54.04 TRINITY_DN3067_c0_g1_i1:130-750(-)